MWLESAPKTVRKIRFKTDHYIVNDKSYVDAQNSFLKTKGHPLLASPTTFWGPKLSFAYICSISIFHLPTGKTFFRFQKKFFDKVAIY